jgi:hypothetical protein
VKINEYSSTCVFVEVEKSFQMIKRIALDLKKKANSKRERMKNRKIRLSI